MMGSAGAHYLELARHWLSQDASVLFYASPGEVDAAVVDDVVHGIPGRRILAQPRGRAAGHRTHRALPDLLSSVHPAEMAALPAPQRKMLTGWISGGAPPNGSSSVDTVASAVVCLLEALGASNRVLLVLRDVHRADPQSRQVLRFVADRADGLPVQMVAVEEVPGSALPQGHRLCPPPLVMIRLPDLRSHPE